MTVTDRIEMNPKVRLIHLRHVAQPQYSGTMLVDFPSLPGVSRPVALEAKHLQAYLDEFAFRFNRRKSRHVGMIFFRLAQHGVQTTPAPYRALVRPARKHHRLRSHDRSG